MSSAFRRLSISDSTTSSSKTKVGDEVLVSSSVEENDEAPQVKAEERKCISVGESLPYGIRLLYGNTDNVIRMKDIGVKKRILVLGVIGSFTPYCWNRHLFRVIKNIKYYEERGIDYICCISTNDPFVQNAWAMHLGCDEHILMISDSSTRFTAKLGMDIVVPWMGSRVRSRRYVIYAEDMIVSKLIVAQNDGLELNWDCDHLRALKSTDSDDDEDSDNWI